MSLASPYDALLFLSFGGPEGPDDVVPFLENVTRGRGIPRERLVEVGAHYFAFGGVSPINGQCRALIAALERDFAGNGLADLPIYWGNRNWDPYVADTVGRMAADGVRRALVFVTSAYSSYSGCRQYREDLAAAVSAADAAGIELDKIRAYYDHPGFVGPNTEAALRALDSLDPALREGAELVFVTHSLPLSLAETSDYVAQHEEVARLVAEGVEKATGVIGRPRALVYCSRSGPPTQPWLEPDVSDHLRERRAAGTEAVVVLPVGFISDHMEVVYDLDTEAAGTAGEIGLAFARAATVGVAPAFVEAIRDLVLERAARERGEDVRQKTLGALGPMPDICAAGCCSNPRGNRPALCGRD